MRKNYSKLSIDPLDPSIVLKTLNQGILKKILLFLVFYLSATITISAQCNSDTPIPFINSTYGNVTASGSLSGVCVCTAFNASRLTDNDLSNFATAVVAINAAGSANYRVTDSDTDYVAGTYVGYRIDTGGLLSVNLLGSITIKTYLNGVLRETASDSSLLGVGLLNLSGNNYVVGFNTTKSFDAIEISVGGLVGLLNTIDVYYPVIRNYCAGPALNCNTASAMNLPAYPVSLEPSHTGISGVSLGNVYDATNVISASTVDYATIALTAGIAASGSIAVKDQLTDYPIGTYAGFEIENSNLLSVSALGNMSITTYLNGVQQDQFFGNNLVVNGSLLNNPGRYKVGFVSTKSFDEVQISINQTLALNLGSTRVYSAVFENFCAGPDLVCNTQTAMLAPTYPVYINGENTGIDGLVCALCSINNAENLIDQNSSNFAQINLTVSVGNSGSISVKNQITDYPIGTFAGFTIENPSLLNVNALDAVTIRTYLNGVLQEIKFGNAALATVGTNLLVGSSLQTIGFVTTKAFDEARITITNTATVSLGVVNVYHAVFQKLCPVILECDKTYALTNPTFPVIIDSGKTGVDGVACVACAVNNTNNVLTSSTTDFATILVTAGVIAPASIAVLDQLSTYPAGTFAGFTIKDLNSLLQLDLFSSLTISTYLDGVLKESKSTSLLLNLSLTLSPFGTGSGMYNVGFQTTQSFDEIRITVGSLASVINDINVYGAFVNTASTSGGTLHCAVIDAVNDPLSPVIGATGNANAGNVLTNDTINATPIAISDIDLTVTAPATPVTVGAAVPSIDPLTGIVSIPAGTPAGNYTITYQICYKLNSLTCDSATVTVAVTAAVIDAVADANTAMVYGSTGGNTGINVYANDTLNLNPVNVSDVVLTSIPNGPLTVHADGSVTVAPNTPGGTYTVDYTICEKLNPTNCDTATVTVFVSAPSIAVVKTGAVGGIGGLGDLITYTFTVTNTGNTPLTNVVINDPLTGSVNLAVTPSTLAPNATGTATATYTIQQVDVDAGKVTNTATVTGTKPDNGTVTDISGTTITNDTPTETNLIPSPSIALVKVGAVGGTGALGNLITYTFTVTNTGNTTLSGIIINDVLTGSVNLAVTPSTLAPNTTGTATATYAIQQVDVDAGKVTNSATVTGTTPSGGTVNDTSGTTVTNDTPTETALTPNSSIALVKVGTVGGTGQVGYAITYTFTVTNKGNTTLSNVVINDPLTASVNLAVTPSTLAPNATGTATATYVIKQSDMDAGKVTNSATVTGTKPIGGTITDISGTTIADDIPTVTTLNPIPSVVLVKTAAVGGTGAVGDIITYTFTVTNTGNTTLSSIVINDALTASVNRPVTPSTLAPNAVGTATATYVIKQSDMNAGKVTNSATVTATTPAGGTVTDTSGTTITNNTPTETTLNPSSSVALVKTGVVGGTGAVGNVITYTFTVTNTGNTTLSNVVVNDALTASVNIAVTPSILLPNITGTVTATYTIKQSDMDAGMVTNSATVTATKPLGGIVTDTSGTTITNNTPTVTTLNPNPSVALVKTAVVGGTGAVGDIVTYTFTVTNIGTTTLNSIVINDALTGTVNLALTPSILAPNAVGTATATYTIKQSDIDAGKITNSAMVTATIPAGGTVTDISGTTITNDIPTETVLTPSSSVALVKAGIVGGTGAVGDIITYTFTVTNTGNTTLSSIIVNDVLTGTVNQAITPSILAPNAVGTATATYTIKQSDIDAGKVTNSATVTATKPTGGTVSDTSGTTITNDSPTVTTLNPSSSITLVKIGVIGGTGAVGDVITYTFTVTNTGNTTLSNIIVNDLLTGSVNLAIAPSILAPNAIGTATATYTIKQSDIDAGKVTNSATVTATTPAGGTVIDISGTTITNDTPTVTTLNPSSSVALVKTGVIGGTGAVGNIITYTFTVTNTGNTTLSSIIVNDALTGSVNVAVTPSILTPNAIGTATVTYTIKQSDIDAGKVTNSATVTATTPAGGTVTDTSGTTITNDIPTVTTLTPSSSVALVKTCVIGGTGAVGDIITYTFTVTNTGNTTLSNIIVNDLLTGTVNQVIIPIALAPSTTGTATATYIIKQSDINAGKITNTATVTATTPTGGTVTDTSGTTITNDTPTVTTLTPSSSVALVKAGVISGTGAVGNIITYTFTVTNTGNTTLSNVVVNDALTASVNIAVTPSTLAPNTIGTATATYVIKQSDINAGKVTNSATVTATIPAGGTVTDTSGTTITNNTPTVTTLNPSSSVALVKAGVVGGTGAVGNIITYTFTVTNTGNTTLNNIVVNDLLTGTVNLSITPSVLAPNAIGTATVTYTIKQSDINAGKVTNSATVTATTPAGGTVTDISGTTITNDTPTVTTLSPNSSVALVKTGVVSGTGAVGNTITYTFTVTNTGNTTLSNVIINDLLTGTVNQVITPSVLAPNATGTVTATYAIKLLDIIAGKVTNSATVTATTPVGGTVTDVSGTTITNDTPTVTTLNPNPIIKITEDGVYVDLNHDGIANVGDAITYSFVITNTGNLALNNLTIADNNTTSMSGSLSTLAVGTSNSTSFTAIYMLTNADIVAGYVYNSATVSALTSVNTTITAVSTDPTPCVSCPINSNCLTCTITAVPQSPSIAIVKKAVFKDDNGDGFAEIGETINYSFKVMNTGNLPLTNVVITDALVGIVISGGPINLAVGQSDSTTFTGVYHITQQDIIKGSVSNQALVKALTPSGAEVVDLSDDDDALHDDPTVLDISGCTLKVFNAVSPDGDGLNDFFRILGIECYPKNTVEIFNRWGVKVYEAEGYNNDTIAFKGISEGRVTVNKSDGLPSGTYFYVVKYEDFSGNGIDKSGYLNISRD
nr:gliding motility-associated C-terminal domain-containing protein [uncultured Flavobacterium sp.]